MNQITPFPKIIGTYETGKTVFEADIEKDVKTILPKTPKNEIEQICAAVSQNTFNLLPDGFQGGRDSSNSGLFVLYTTR